MPAVSCGIDWAEDHLSRPVVRSPVTRTRNADDRRGDQANPSDVLLRSRLHRAAQRCPQFCASFPGSAAGSLSRERLRPERMPTPRCGKPSDHPLRSPALKREVLPVDNRGPSGPVCCTRAGASCEPSGK
jgi:hypothetical protein